MKAGNLDQPAAIHTDGFKSNWSNGNRKTTIISGNCNIIKADKAYTESWQRDAARFEAEKTARLKAEKAIKLV
jgi:hypothetical protein